MCGIVGYIGSKTAVDVLVPALKRLEYRGYDSSGVATVGAHGLEVRKSIGKIANLEAMFTERGFPAGSLGIAHTRWVTHGRPCEMNAHPHVDCQNRFAVVHNGIIENYQQLRASLSARGHQFRSQTDTEVIAHLIESCWTSDLPDAIARAAAELRGSYAIAAISKEQRATLAGRIDRDGLEVELDGLGLEDRELASLSRVSFMACGTSWHAALVGRYLIEEWARLSADAEIASELRHRHPVSEPGLLAVPISQSGETADTLAASRQVHAQGSRVVAVSNIVGSSLAREADGVLYTRAGLEIGVAATKSFTSQLAALMLLALKIARARGAADRYDAAEIIDALLT